MMESSVAMRVKRLANRIPRWRKIIAFVGPSAVGKSRMVCSMLEYDPDMLIMPSYTTRDPRPTDLPGEYTTVSLKTFQDMEQRHKFAWTTPLLHGARYGTTYQDLNRACGNIPPTVMHLMPGSVPKLVEVVQHAVCLIFLTAPPDTLDQRLRARDKGKPNEYYEERVQTCLSWEHEARQGQFPYHFVTNLDNAFEQAFAEVIKIVTETHQSRTL